MKNLTKAILLLSSSIILAGCVEDDAYTTNVYTVHSHGYYSDQTPPRSMNVYIKDKHHHHHNNAVPPPAYNGYSSSGTYVSPDNGYSSSGTQADSGYQSSAAPAPASASSNYQSGSPGEATAVPNEPAKAKGQEAQVASAGSSSASSPSGGVNGFSSSGSN